VLYLIRIALQPHRQTLDACAPKSMRPQES